MLLYYTLIISITLINISMHCRSHCLFKITAMKHLSSSEAIIINIIMFSRQCLSNTTRFIPTFAASRPPIHTLRWRWELSLWAMVITSGCLMLNAPTTTAFDIGEFKAVISNYYNAMCTPGYMRKSDEYRCMVLLVLGVILFD